MHKEKKGRISAFNISFGACDAEAAEWFSKQPNKGAYLKALILADKALCDESEIVPKPKHEDSLWEEHFHLLKEFKEQFGRLPSYSESYKGFRLGRWLHDTVRRARVSRPDRIEKLQSIGVVDKWERNLALVERFKEVYDRLPCRNESYQGVNIGAWLAMQTARLRNEREWFSQEQLKMLSDLEIFASDWDRKCRLLEAFLEEHDRLPKYTEIYREVRLGRWLAYQRKTLDPVKHADRIERLGRLGAFSRPLHKKQLQKKA